MMTANEISKKLTQRVEEIAKYLLPNGKKDGNEWRVGSIDGEQGKSLGVHLTGEKTGMWCDFATGESGKDLLDLWALKRNMTLSGAMKDAGFGTPWQKTREKIFFRPEELSTWTGINGHGKSQFLGHLILNWIKEGARVCIASLELKPKRLLMRLTRQAACTDNPTDGFIRAIHEWYGDQLWLFDLVGNAKSQRLLDVFLYARQRYGIEIFVIDSLMKLDIAEDDYKAQKALMDRICDFKNQHNCQIHLVVHPRKMADETHIPSKLDSKGTGAITDVADNCFCVWRNKKKEEIKNIEAQGAVLTSEQKEKLEQFDVLLICDKQRNGEWEGKLGFNFDPKSCQYLGDANSKVIQYVDYSVVK